MKKFTILVSFIFAFYAENTIAQSWELVSKDDFQEFFYDSSSIKGTRYQRKITARRNILGNSVNGEKSSLLEISINCDMGILVYESIKIYPQIELKGAEKVLNLDANSVKTKSTNALSLISAKACVEKNNFQDVKDLSDMALVRNIPKIEVQKVSNNQVIYRIPLDFYSTVHPTQPAGGQCELRLLVNDKPLQTLKLVAPLSIRIPVDTNTVNDANISWENKTPISGGRVNCVGQGDIFLSELFASEWRALEGEFNLINPQGGTCLIHGMNFKKMPYYKSTIDKNGLSYPSIHNAVSKEVISICRNALNKTISKNYSCSFGPDKRTTKCNDDWYELRDNKYFRVSDFKSAIEGILAGKNIEVMTVETPEANAAYKVLVAQQLKEAEEKQIREAKAAEEKRIQEAKAAEERRIQEAKEAEERRIQEAKEAEEKRIQEAKDAKEAEERRIWLTTPAGKKFAAAEAAKAKKEEAERQKYFAVEEAKAKKEEADRQKAAAIEEARVKKEEAERQKALIAERARIEKEELQRQKQAQSNQSAASNGVIAGDLSQGRDSPYCEKMKNWASGSRELVAAYVGESMSSISLIRFRKGDLSCLAVIDTPKGPVNCRVEKIRKDEKSGVFYADLRSFLGDAVCSVLRNGEPNPFVH